MSTEAITLATKEANTELTAAQAAQVMLDGFTIANEDDNEFAAEVLRDVKAKFKEVESKRTGITKPMLEAKRQVDALFKPVLEALAMAEGALKEKIAAYLAATHAANVAAIQAASTAESAEDAAAALATVEAVSTPAGVSTRVMWEPEVIAEDLLMPQFMSPDYGKIKAWMKLHQDADGKPLPIPGVRFNERTVVISRKV